MLESLTPKRRDKGSVICMKWVSKSIERDERRDSDYIYPLPLFLSFYVLLRGIERERRFIDTFHFHTRMSTILHPLSHYILCFSSLYISLSPCKSDSIMNSSLLQMSLSSSFTIIISFLAILLSGEDCIDRSLYCTPIECNTRPVYAMDYCRRTCKACNGRYYRQLILFIFLFQRLI